jgi:hypothetical protein
MLVGGAFVSSRAMAKQSAAEATKSESQKAKGKDEQTKPPKDYQEEMEEFEPTEKVPADSAISFPVDI